MLKKFWEKTKEILTTEVSGQGLVEGATDAANQLLTLAEVLQDNEQKDDLKFLFDNLSGLPSLLTVLNSPLAKVAGAALPFLPLATGIITYIAEKDKKILTLSESVLLVAQVSYLESVRNFFQQYPSMDLRSESTSKKLTFNEIKLDKNEAKEVLLCFHESKLAQPFNKLLLERLKESGLKENAAQLFTEQVSRGTFRHLREAVNQVWDKVPDLQNLLGQGYLDEMKLYASLDRYLEEAIAQKPTDKVFDEEFSFKDIYVPSQVKPLKGDESPKNIETWAEQLLARKGEDAKVLFIQAGPGRGKGVFCRMFADKVFRELHPIWTPIFIRLRDIEKLGDTFEETLQKNFQEVFAKEKDWLLERNTRFLFFLDGFDELLLSGDATGELKKLLGQVEKFQGNYNGTRSGKDHRIILTGRPFALYGIEGNMPGNFEQVKIVLMDDESQTCWLKKWDAVHKRELSKGFWNFLKRCPEEVQILAREPLLLYLLAAMHRDVDELTTGMFAALEDESGRGRNPEVAAKILIYQRAIDWVLNKQRFDPKWNENITEKLVGLESKDLRKVLQETGLCAVQSGREYAKLKMVENRLDNEIVKALQAAHESSEKKSFLASAMTAFYMRAGGEGAVEFVHKSFGEFLCAERLVEGMLTWTQKSEKREEEVCWQIYDLLGYGHLSWEILDYVLELLQEKERLREGFLVILGEQLQNFYWRWSGGEFIEDVEKMLPRKKTKQLQELAINNKGQRAIDVYAGYNVLKVLFALHERGVTFYPCGEHGSEVFDKTRLLRLMGYGACLSAFTFFEELRLHLRGADLRGADLRGANLRGANFRGADLRETNLEGVDLRRANLRRANLRGADLQAADLREADLRGANLKGVDLRAANVWHAKYSPTTLLPTINITTMNMTLVEDDDSS
ncbi:MAG: NACHT domain-containing NTPase [Xenococcus sp. (in: cyanobacteria)]